MAKMTLQVSYGLTAPFDLSVDGQLALDQIVKNYFCEEIYPTKPNDKRASARWFASRASQELAEMARHNANFEERKSIEEFGRGLFLDILYRATEPMSPKHLLGHALLDEVDWRFPSRYAASKELQRIAQKKGESTYLRESAFSKLEHSGKGISAERMSEAFYLLGLSIFARPYLGEPRIIVQNEVPNLKGGPEQTPNKKEILEADMRKYFVEGLTNVLQEPLGILVPLKSSQPKNLIPINSWRSSPASDSWPNIIRAAREKIAERAGIKLEKIQVHKTESREMLSYSTKIDTDYAILASLLDLGAPLLDNMDCLFVRIPSDDSYHAVTSASFIEAIPKDKETGNQFKTNLEEKIKKLHERNLGIFDIFYANANIATSFARNYRDKSKSQNIECLSGPLPRALGLGGIHSFYLFSYLVNRLHFDK